MKDSVFGWHFVGDRLRDGRPVPADGEWLVHDDLIRICVSGLHGSRHPADALQYAPGAVLCYCEFRGVVTEQSDKLVARERRIVRRMDATSLLRYFARMCALQAIDYARVSNIPPSVAEYLMTGDESSRDAAWDAARSAAGAAAGDAAGAAAWDAAWDAARSAARAAAWDAARDAVLDAARAAALDAAWDAARSAAWAAAWDAARDAALAAIYTDFLELVHECFYLNGGQDA